MSTDKSILTLDINKLDISEFPGFVHCIYNAMRMSDYVTTGEYFMTLYDEDLQELIMSVDGITVPEGFEDPIAFKNVLTLTILLRIAEGSPDVSEKDLHKSMSTVCTYAAMEGLARAGHVEIFHQNMCVADDSLDDSRIVARRIKDE